MKDKVIEYKSTPETVSYKTIAGMNVLEIVNKEGILWSWSGVTTNERYRDGYDGRNYTLNFTWTFDWTELQNQGVESLTGHLIVKPAPKNPNHFVMKKIDINWKGGKETITEKQETRQFQFDALFEFHLTAHYSESKKVSYDEMFAASDLTDVILVVEGKKLHVNKAFLSIHSEFFRALFSWNFEEGEMAEIPIQDVSYADFGLLLNTIYPKQVFPNDKTVEKLLELADGFLMPSVTHIVEHHLLEHSKIENEKLMFMADAYGMPALLDKCIGSMNTVEKVKAAEKSEEFNKMSLQTSHKLFKRLLQIV